MEDFCCKEGYVKMIVTESKLLKHANEVYTIGAYRLFEEQFMKFPKYCQGLVAIVDKYILKRWTNDIDLSSGSSSVDDVRKVSENDIADKEVGSSNIKDPVGRCAKGERNIRKKSIVEIKCNQARGKERVL
ncbi:hypothetical protein M9H77_21586 [Catharanthus roseus]|uniref:Uncharacterized protein n=1 Tax=Catharanthus roseus TaxID=4058 RepID=A0ACC0AMR7_CATRO|nr:hypothetical protein M9H77_21586 [Catharanthus roseus]